jgi:hypothetical protein
MAETSGAQDIQALHDALVGTVRQSAYDDMAFAEISVSFDRALHTLRVLFMKYGTIDQGTIDAANPPPEQPLATDSPLARDR